MKNQSEVIKVEWWQQGLFEPYRNKIIYGGRGSGKSYLVVDGLIIESL